YNTSNNNKEALAGSGQEEFPDTEMHAVAHYLFGASDDYLAEIKAYQDVKGMGSPAQKARDAELQALLQNFGETKAAQDKRTFEAFKNLPPASIGQGKKRWEKLSTLSKQDLERWAGQLATFNGLLPGEQNKDVTRLLEIELKEVSRRIKLREV